MSLEIDTAKLDLSHFPFDSIKFSVDENRLIVSLYLKSICLKTWTSFTGMPIGSTLTIHGVDGTVDLSEDCDDL